MSALTGTIGAAQSAVSISTNINASGAQAVGAVGMNLVSSAFTGTIVFEATTDGNNWFAVAAYPVLASGLPGSAVSSTTAAGQFTVPVAGWTAVRARCSAFTSGIMSAFLDVSAGTTGQLFVNTEGQKQSYSATSSALAVVASATDLAILPGSATKTIRVTRVIVSLSQATAAAYLDIQLIKRSTANTGGTSSGMTITPFDSNNAATSTSPLAYTGNPTLGTPVGPVASARYFAPLTGTAAPVTQLVFDFGNRPSQCPTLRGIAQGLAVSFGSGGGPANASTADITFEYTEE